MSRDIKMFKHPEMVYDFLSMCKKIGLSVIITCVDRSYKEQTALFAQGREPYSTIKELRKIAGMPSISEKESKRKVTWTMNSKHIINLDDEKLTNDKSKAIDFAVIKDGVFIEWDLKADINNNNISDYLEVAKIGESVGFKSGRHFKNPDYPHLEID